MADYPSSRPLGDVSRRSVGPQPAEGTADRLSFETETAKYCVRACVRAPDSSAQHNARLSSGLRQSNFGEGTGNRDDELLVADPLLTGAARMVRSDDLSAMAPAGGQDWAHAFLQVAKIKKFAHLRPPALACNQHDLAVAESTADVQPLMASANTAPTRVRLAR